MKYLYTAIFLLYLSQGSVAAQEKGGFFDKIKGTFSSEIKNRDVICLAEGRVPYIPVK